MTAKRYDDEQLCLLLRLLRRAPTRWLARAKRIPLGTLATDDVSRLAQKLKADSAFKRSFDSDPVAALETAEMRELAEHLRVEWEELVAAPDAWLDEMPEVVAHGGGEAPPDLRLRALLLESAAARATLGS
jgi:hypothetical protein